MQLNFEKKYSLTTTNRPKNFIVIGAGGTGGYLIPNLARFMALQNKMRKLAGMTEHVLTIVDGDFLEDKNLNRQNFISADVNKNKADVMANRYSRAFGMPIRVVPSYIESEEQLANLCFSRKSNTVLLNMGIAIGRNDGNPFEDVFVDCVDNNKTRVIIHQVHKRHRSYFVSSGNEEFHGQVVMGYNIGNGQDGFRLPNLGETRPHRFSLPDVCDVFPEVLLAEDKLPTEMSCAERSVSAPQNIYTNQTAAHYILGFTNRILAEKPISCFAITYDAQEMTSSTRFNKISDLKNYQVSQ